MIPSAAPPVNALPFIRKAFATAEKYRFFIKQMILKKNIKYEQLMNI